MICVLDRDLRLGFSYLTLDLVEGDLMAQVGSNEVGGAKLIDTRIFPRQTFAA